MSKIYVPVVGGKHGLIIDNSRSAITGQQYLQMKEADREVARVQCNILSEQLDEVLESLKLATIRRKDRRALVLFPYNAILDLDMVEIGGKSDKLEDENVLEEAKQIITDIVEKRCNKVMDIVNARYDLLYISVDVAEDENAAVSNTSDMYLNTTYRKTQEYEDKEDVKE